MDGVGLLEISWSNDEAKEITLFFIGRIPFFFPQWWDLTGWYWDILGHCHSLPQVVFGFSEVVRKSRARCVLAVPCTTFSLGVVGSDSFSAHAPCVWEDAVCNLLWDLRAYRSWHCWYSMSTPCKMCKCSVHVGTNTCAAYDPACCCPGLGQTLRGHPRCVIVYSCANSRVKRAVPLGPTFRYKDVYTLLPTLWDCILLFESPRIYNNILRFYYSVRKDPGFRRICLSLHLDPVPVIFQL